MRPGLHDNRFSVMHQPQTPDCCVAGLPPPVLGYQQNNHRINLQTSREHATLRVLAEYFQVAFGQSVVKGKIDAAQKHENHNDKIKIPVKRTMSWKFIHAVGQAVQVFYDAVCPSDLGHDSIGYHFETFRVDGHPFFRKGEGCERDGI